MICDCIFHVIASLHPNPHCTHLHIVTSDKITTPISSPRERPRARNGVVGGGNLHEGFVSLDMHHELDIAGLGDNITPKLPKFQGAPKCVPEGGLTSCTSKGVIGTFWVDVLRENVTIGDGELAFAEGGDREPHEKVEDDETGRWVGEVGHNVTVGNIPRLIDL